MTNLNRHDGLPAPVWLEFEALRYSKTPEIRRKYGTFGAYWNWLQAQQHTGIEVIGGTLLVLM